MTYKKLIQKVLGYKQDKKYRDFQASLIPTIDKKYIIGVRTPILKKIAQIFYKNRTYETYLYLYDLPHTFFEENQFHSFMISNEKDYDICIDLVNHFLPYIDNWATCDQLNPKIFANNKIDLLNNIKKWIISKHCYTVRFGIRMIMNYYLDEDFDIKYLKMVSKINFPYDNKKIIGNINQNDCPDKYYVEMMIAWFYATALCKQYKQTLNFLKTEKINQWTFNKTIQKAIESYRITDKQKIELKRLKKI